MKAMYCEVGKSQGYIRVNIYSGAGKMERIEERRERRRTRYVEKQRKLVHVRETAGAFIGLFGFILLMGIDGQETMSGIAALGCAGLALMVLGAWMGHAFYGQEKQAEWLRRMRERGEIE